MADDARHPDAVALAEYAERLLDPSRLQAVDDHVRDCADCTGVLSELAELPQTIAQAPLPPLPDDVAARLDRAIAAESAARASEWSGAAAARVSPIRRARRWLAPLASAAAVIAVIAIAIPAIDSGDNGQDDASSADSASAPRDTGDLASAPNGVQPQAQMVALTSKHFGRDVIDTYYSGSSAVRIEARLTSAAVDRTYDEATERVPGLCALASGSAVPHGEIDAITLDGEPARLLRRDQGDAVDVIAFGCDDNRPSVLDAVTLRRR